MGPGEYERAALQNLEAGTGPSNIGVAVVYSLLCVAAELREIRERLD